MLLDLSDMSRQVMHKAYFKLCTQSFVEDCALTFQYSCICCCFFSIADPVLLMVILSSAECEVCQDILQSSNDPHSKYITEKTTKHNV